jgi:uncharacterized Zn finger protein (UPF0148 family)
MPDAVPNIPSVMNGEPCPGCKTPIWGMRPKNCFICGYNFDNPEYSQTFEARVAAEEERLKATADVIFDDMDLQRQQEKQVAEQIEAMVQDFLGLNWPDWSDERMAEVFKEAVLKKWPMATFPNLEVESFMNSDHRSFTKRIKGEMDRADLRILGFKIEGELIDQKR